MTAPVAMWSGISLHASTIAGMSESGIHSTNCLTVFTKVYERAPWEARTPDLAKEAGDHNARRLSIDEQIETMRESLLQACISGLEMQPLLW
eukprot:4932041-Amphidinium_carterae.1